MEAPSETVALFSKKGARGSKRALSPRGESSAARTAHIVEISLFADVGGARILSDRSAASRPFGRMTSIGCREVKT